MHEYLGVHGTGLDHYMHDVLCPDMCSMVVIA